METESFCFNLVLFSHCIMNVNDHHLRHFAQRMCVRSGLDPISMRVWCVWIYHCIVWTTKLFVSRNTKTKRRSHNEKISELMLRESMKKSTDAMEKEIKMKTKQKRKSDICETVKNECWLNCRSQLSLCHSLYLCPHSTIWMNWCLMLSLFMQCVHNFMLL